MCIDNLFLTWLKQDTCSHNSATDIAIFHTVNFSGHHYNYNIKDGLEVFTDLRCSLRTVVYAG